MPSEEELFALVDDIYSKEEFTDLILEKEKEFDGLLSKDTIAHLIVAKNNRNTKVIKNISDLEIGQTATIEGKVLDIGKLVDFNKNGNSGRVRNVRIDDGTGSINVVFWDGDTERIGNEIKKGCDIKVINGYVQNKGYGLQIQTGKWGEVRVIDNEKD
ncbi:MAG: OB-fold nucleic acid binding domain-containing protein [Thermoplasmatota archaeon]